MHRKRSHPPPEKCTVDVTDSTVNVMWKCNKHETGVRPLSAGACHSLVHRVPGPHLLFIPCLPCGEQGQQAVCHLC